VCLKYSWAFEHTDANGWVTDNVSLSGFKNHSVLAGRSWIISFFKYFTKHFQYYFVAHVTNTFTINSFLPTSKFAADKKHAYRLCRVGKWLVLWRNNRRLRTDWKQSFDGCRLILTWPWFIVRRRLQITASPHGTCGIRSAFPSMTFGKRESNVYVCYLLYLRLPTRKLPLWPCHPKVLGKPELWKRKGRSTTIFLVTWKIQRHFLNFEQCLKLFVDIIIKSDTPSFATACLNAPQWISASNDVLNMITKRKTLMGQIKLYSKVIRT